MGTFVCRVGKSFSPGIHPGFSFASLVAQFRLFSIRVTQSGKFEKSLKPPEEAFFLPRLHSPKLLDIKNGGLAERTLRLLQRLRPLHHLLHYSLLHLWQKCRGSRRKLFPVRLGFTFRSSVGHLRRSPQTKTQGAQGHRWIAGGRYSGVLVLSVLRGGANGRGSEGGRSRRPDDGERMILIRRIYQPIIDLCNNSIIQFRYCNTF